jgi:hypothetical protein
MKIKPVKINQKHKSNAILGDIKYDQIHHYFIDWFEKIHPFLNMLVSHLTPFGAL